MLSRIKPPIMETEHKSINDGHYEYIGQCVEFRLGLISTELKTDFCSLSVSQQLVQLAALLTNPYQQQ